MPFWQYILINLPKHFNICFVGPQNNFLGVLWIVKVLLVCSSIFNFIFSFLFFCQRAEESFFCVFHGELHCSITYAEVANDKCTKMLVSSSLPVLAVAHRFFIYLIKDFSTPTFRKSRQRTKPTPFRGSLSNGGLNSLRLLCICFQHYADQLLLIVSSEMSFSAHHGS